MTESLYILTLFDMLCFISGEIAMDSSNQVSFNLLTLEIASSGVEFMFHKILDEFSSVVLRGFAIEFIIYDVAVTVVNRYLS